MYILFVCVMGVLKKYINSQCLKLKRGGKQVLECVLSMGRKTPKIPTELELLTYWELEQRRCRELQVFVKKKKVLEIFGFFNYVQIKLN